MKKYIAIAKFVLLGFSLQLSLPAQANLIERILANPKVQALISKPAELTNWLKLCENARYKASNQEACTEAEQAAMVNRLPIEMRTLMSNAKSAQSLRDLCLAAQSTPQRDSYLCGELVKADAGFAGIMQGARQTIDSQGGANASN